MKKFVLSILILFVISSFIYIPLISFSQCSWCVKNLSVFDYQCYNSGGADYDCFQFVNGRTSCCFTAGSNVPCDQLYYDTTLWGYNWEPANGICTNIQFCDSCSPVNFWIQDPIVQGSGGPRCMKWGSPTSVMGRNMC